MRHPVPSCWMKAAASSSEVYDTEPRSLLIALLMLWPWCWNWLINRCHLSSQLCLGITINGPIWRLGENASLWTEMCWILQWHSFLKVFFHSGNLLSHGLKVTGGRPCCIIWSCDQQILELRCWCMDCRVYVMARGCCSLSPIGGLEGGAAWLLDPGGVSLAGWLF
jgi:hypothetical protein